MLFAYNLACYACQLGHLQEAREWLRRAIAIENAESIKAMALRDADLRPLWNEIQEYQ
jgi:hypothetical protein